MKNIFYLIIFFTLVNCANNNLVYWCGDHPCVNKKEKEVYFKKTMIVEVKELKGTKFEKKSELEKITQQINLEEKDGIKKERKLAKQAKLEEKMKIREGKELAKQAKKEEKIRIKEDKELAQQIELDEKKITKKIEESPEEKITVETSSQINEADNNSFIKLVEKITKRNSLKSYPNINNTPN